MRAERVVRVVEIVVLVAFIIFGLAAVLDEIGATDPAGGFNQLMRLAQLVTFAGLGFLVTLLAAEVLLYLRGGRHQAEDRDERDRNLI